MDDQIVIWRARPDESPDIIRLKSDSVEESLNQATRRLPGGGYTTFRTFGRRRVLRLFDHIRRLEETAALAGVKMELNRDQFSHFLRVALANFPFDLVRVRVILDLEEVVGTLYILLEELKVPSPREYEQGTKVVTRRMKRKNPKAKLTGFIETAAVVQQALQPGINEALMVGDDGRVLEGLSSNFFGVRRGKIWTAEEGVLEGITRTLVLEVIAETGMSVEMQGVRFDELTLLDEAFITSASRAVLPITEIDGKLIGGGKPGEITQALFKGYQERVEAELEEV